MSTRFFFNGTATTEIYTLSLHDALPILFENLLRRRLLVKTGVRRVLELLRDETAGEVACKLPRAVKDRKSTRLNSSHANISYAVFCLKKKQLPRSLMSTLSTSSFPATIS